MLCVKVFWPDGHPITRSFTKNEVLIGRKSSNDIILAGQDVSGTHACLQIENGCVTLVDLGSTNGTFVNSERVQVSAQLAPADEIKISVFTLHVSVGDEHPAAPPSAAWDPAPAEPASPLPPSLPRIAPTPGAAPPPSSPMPGPPIAPMVGPAEPRAPTGPLPQIADAPPPIGPARRGPIPPPPVRRAPGPDAVAPSYGSPARTADEPAIVDDDRPSTTRAAPAVVTGPASRDADTDLARAWADPGVQRIVISGLRPALVERDGVCAPLGQRFISVDDLRDQLAAVCGRPVLRELPTECVLADGTAVQAILAGEPQVILTRPRRGAPTSLAHDRDLPPLAARLLASCARARLPLLIAARPGAACAPLLAALLAEVHGATGFVRGLPTPVVPPHACKAVDAGHGGGHMAAALRLLLATDAGSLAIDEPEAAALDECAWAHAGGRGVLVGVRAGSLEHALLRARAAGAASTAPTIAYALAVVLGADPPTATVNDASFQVIRIVELRHGEAHEIFARDRGGALLAIAAPALLDELARRGDAFAGA